MHKRVRFFGVWLVVATAVLSVAYYAALVHELKKQEPSFLRVCTTTEVFWLGWTCKQVLYRASWNPEHVRHLNESAGARLAFGSEVPKNTRETDEIEQHLKLFLARGVDINAVNIRNDGWTALHGAAASTGLHEAQLLLKYGARTDLRDAKGLTALDIAVRVQQKSPDNPKAIEMVRLLQAHTTSPQK